MQHTSSIYKWQWCVTRQPVARQPHLALSPTKVAATSQKMGWPPTPKTHYHQSSSDGKLLQTHGRLRNMLPERMFPCKSQGRCKTNVLSSKASSDNLSSLFAGEKEAYMMSNISRHSVKTKDKLRLLADYYILIITHTDYLYYCYIYTTYFQYFSCNILPVLKKSIMSQTIGFFSKHLQITRSLNNKKNICLQCHVFK